MVDVLVVYFAPGDSLRHTPPTYDIRLPIYYALYFEVPYVVHDAFLIHFVGKKGSMKQRDSSHCQRTKSSYCRDAWHEDRNTM